MRSLAAVLIAPSLVLAAPAAAQTGPSAALAGLLRADRSFSEAAAGIGPVDGIAAMFAADVTMPIRGALVNGREAVIAAMRASPGFTGIRARWSPIGGTVSADGRHGFTAGLLEIEGASRAGARRRYLAYWLRRPEGWRVAAYRQVIRPQDEVEAPAYAPALPHRPVRGGGAAASLRAAEQAFSDRAQQVGLRVAFGEFGRPDAVHIAGEHGFNIGLPAITAEMPQEVPATLTWHSDRLLVAASGDLGVSIGRIHPTAGGADIPFFTVWRRDPGGPWRYIAE